MMLAMWRSVARMRRLFCIVVIALFHLSQCRKQQAPRKSHTIYEDVRPSVAVVTMIKNEGDILGHWLEYHSLLFGVSNIVALDNYSTDNTTRTLLATWQAKGLHVEYKQGPYIKMGDLAYAALNKHFPTHQLAIPLDADEFIVAYRNGVPIAYRTTILKTIHTAWMQGGPCFSFRQYYGSYPTRANDTIETVDLFTKIVYSSRTAKKMLWLQDIEQIAFGAHQGTLKGGPHEKLKCTTVLDWLGLLHYHLRSPRVTAERALRDCIALKYLPKSVTLENIKTHLPKLEEMVREHKQSHNIAFHKIEELLKYAQQGDQALVYPDIDTLVRVGTIQYLIDQLKHT